MSEPDQVPLHEWQKELLEKRMEAIAARRQTPVFVGTRVPVPALIDYLEGGRTLAEFLDDFPSVKREQAIAALEQAKKLLVLGAPTAR